MKTNIVLTLKFKWINSPDDEDGLGVEFYTHEPSIKWKRMKPHLGERYKSLAQFKLCVGNYEIGHGYNLRFVKSNSVRVVVICGNKGDKKLCP